MFWLKSQQRPLRARRPHSRPRTRLFLETLEDRCVPSVTDVVVGPINAVEGPNTKLQVATVTDNDPSVTANQLVVFIDYADGTKEVTNEATPPPGILFDPNLKVTGSAGHFTITDNHTFPEESGSTVPPFSFTATVTVQDPSSTFTKNGQAFVTDAPITDGDPVPVGPGTQFFGGNQGNSISTAQALANFEAAIGGTKNTAAAPQNGGFRVINWDAVKTDGTDSVAGPNSTTVITPGHTVGIPLDRFQGAGVIFGAVYAVSNDGFQDVNPNVGPGAGDPKGLFPAFSAPNTFAMFNDNGIDFTFVAPSSPTTDPVSAASRGFGAVFLNVQQPGTTIQYFHGNTLIDTLDVPTNSTPGAAVFAGELFDSPEVTNVLLTLGQGVIFKFDGTTIASGGANSASNNLVVVDDWVFPEPVPIVNGTNIPVSAPIGVAPGTLNAAVLVHATAGQSFTGVAANFSDADPNANARDFTALINWGDGHASNGTIVADGKGGFAVLGTNTYASAGAFPIAVQIQDFGGSFFTVTNTASVAPSPPPPVTTGNLNFTESPQGLFGLAGFLVQPLASNNQPVGPALDVPFFLSTLLTLEIAHITSLNRDASGNVAIDISLAGITLGLNYNGAGQLTGASAFGISIPVSLI